VRNKLNWVAAFQKDPVAASDRYVREWAKHAFHPRTKPKREPEQMPSDLWEQGKREWHLDQDVRGAVRAAAREQADRDGSRLRRSSERL
jgi:hypothetical protein